MSLTSDKILMTSRDRSRSIFQERSGGQPSLRNSQAKYDVFTCLPLVPVEDCALISTMFLRFTGCVIQHSKRL